MNFSVITPTLNEAGCIEATIRRIRGLDHCAQIIVADGGSTDGTLDLVRHAGAEIVISSPGRGVQCNAGARQGSGEILLFLHADTLLPSNAFQLLSHYFRNRDVQIGTFRLAFDEPKWLLRVYSGFTRFDSAFTRFGDQCIVVRKTFFEKLGGFPNWPLFEDVQLLRAARRYTRIVSFPAAVTTSARRFMKVGLIRTQLLNGWLMLQYFLGVSPNKLAAQYAAPPQKWSHDLTPIHFAD